MLQCVMLIGLFDIFIAVFAFLMVTYSNVEIESCSSELKLIPFQKLRDLYLFAFLFISNFLLISIKFLNAIYMLQGHGSLLEYIFL